MLELKNVPEGQIERIADILGLDLFEDEQLFIALDGQEVKGWCLYALTDLQVVIAEVYADEEDEFIKDGLIRAVMNFAYNHGIRYADFDEDVDGDMLDRMGFSEDGRHYNLFISKYFSGCEDLSS